METPQSVEEAGALLGAAITKCNAANNPTIAPPKGMHSSFGISETIPSSELFTRLYQLRSILQDTAARASPLLVAPSLMAVLMKLLGVSSSLAPLYAVDARVTTPPLWSTPIRRIWVDCVVICASAMDVLPVCRNMLALAALHPKSSKAAGGTRIAAMQVVRGLLEAVPNKLAPWALDILVVCQRSLKSSGHNEPTYRIMAVRTACAAATACRKSWQTTKPNLHPLLLKNAMEDLALQEVMTILKLASADKYPEVRIAAGTLCGIVAPMFVVNTKIPQGEALLLEEVLTLAYKNTDDEQTGVAVQWAQALARLLTTLIVYQAELKASQSTRKREQEQASQTKDVVVPPLPDTDDAAMRFSSRKTVTWAFSCSALRPTIQFLVDCFVKAGGEFQAARLGSPFSTGGRAVRLGISLTLVHLLNMNIHSISNEELADITTDILQMVGSDKQFLEMVLVDGLDVTCVETPEKTTMFSSSKKSPADAGLARLATNRVLREGLVASEPTQLKLLQILVAKLDTPELNAHQLQVVWIETSHLLSTLGEAAGSSVNDLIPLLKRYLQHADHGVRHETTICCAALATSFPMHGRTLFRDTINDVQVQHAELVTLASLEVPRRPGDLSPKKNRFRRNKEEKEEDKSMGFQYAIHGQALMLAVLLRELPHLPGGLPQEFMTMAMSVAEILVCTQALEHLTKKYPGGVCTCVRAGYGILSGGLTVGAHSIAPHITLVYSLWKKAERSVKEGTQNFTPDQELICLDAALSSIVAFLEHCSELLLAVQDALSRTTFLLELVMPLFLPDGRWGSAPASVAVKPRHESAKASIMEAYAWLPPGSYPMIANEVFSFALAHIQTGTEAEVTCSILPTLVNDEDKILDTKSTSRAQRYWQISGARDVEDNLITLNSEPAHHGERESVLHFQSSTLRYDTSKDHSHLWGSQILGLLVNDGTETAPPTPLHEVGTWRMPVAPSCSSKIRLMDAAVQAFSATFGLKDGKEQQSAMLLLESLVPPILAQLARAIGVNTALTEQERRIKTKEDNAAISNITAVLLCCLKALPLHESTHDIPIGLAPAWMNKAKDLLLTLLPSTSNIVRRAASEGLALLATLGVTEDAHTLQSTVLHSLDEVMQGNKPDGKPRAIPLESISAARAGSLLTLACIQRTAFNIRAAHRARRGRSCQTEKADEESDVLPTIQMMTRILPSVACHAAIRDAFVVRTYAMHAFTLLIAYSATLTRSEAREEDLHLLKKGVEMVEDNFLACWCAVSADMDQGQEPAKLAAEASFLSVLLRTMSFLTPHIGVLADVDADIADRFMRMAMMVVEDHGCHPVVLSEGLAFFEILSNNSSLLGSSEHPLSCCAPFILECLKPNLLQLHAVESWNSLVGTLSSPQALRAGVVCAKLLATYEVIDVWGSQLPSTLFALLESIAGNRTCAAETFYRPLAVSRGADIGRSLQVVLEAEICTALDTILFSSGAESGENCQSLVRWALMARPLIVGSSEQERDGDEGNEITHTKTGASLAAAATARADAAPVFNVSSPCRWQVRCQAARCLTTALQEIALNAAAADQYDSGLAIKALQGLQLQGTKPPSFLTFHLSELLSAASTAVVATVDQSELRLVQQGGLRILHELVSSFGAIRDPEEPGVSILEQYSSQVLSAAKHGVSAAEGEPSDVSYPVLIAGCDVLGTILKKGLISDPVVFKRMIRPVIPAKRDLPFVKYGSSDMAIALRAAATSEHGDLRSILLPRITKLLCMARIRGLIDSEILSETVGAFLVDETKSFEVEIGVHSAAIVIDGARLLREANLCLCGSGSFSSVDEPQEDESAETVKPGLLFGNIYDIDDATKASLVSWPACAFQATLLLSKQVTSNNGDRGIECKKWLDNILPILFVGFKDASLCMGQPLKFPIAWAQGLTPGGTMIYCLKGLRSLLDTDFMDTLQGELPSVISALSDIVILPSLRLSPTIKSIVIGEDLLAEACTFIQAVSASNVDDSVITSLLLAILTPLDAAQQGIVIFDETKGAPLVVVSFMKAIESIVGKSSSHESLVDAMLQLSMDMLSNPNSPKAVAVGAESLLASCFATNGITPARQRMLARDMAKQGKWDAWCIVCGRSQEALNTSIGIVAEALRDLTNFTRHSGALAALRTIVSTPTTNSTIVGIAMQRAGAEVIGLLKAHGTHAVPSKEAQSHRLSICGDSMKILMVSYNQLAPADESILTAFVTLVFECWIAIIQYNGLPNQASPQPGADAMLGKVSAQAIMHVARTTPAAFKSSMGGLSDHARAILEFAVRSDMSGYVNTNTNAPAKKKLDLKSFKK